MQLEASCARRKLVAYCILRTVEGAMEGVAKALLVHLKMRWLPAEEAAGASRAVGKSSIEFRRAGTKRFRLHFPPGDIPDESHCDALRFAGVLFGSPPKISPQMIVCIFGGYETNKGFRVHNCPSQRNPRHFGYACSRVNSSTTPLWMQSKGFLVRHCGGVNANTRTKAASGL